MIVVGYPCIGKSSVCKKNVRFIDLDYTNFKEFQTYIKVALDLDRQGYIVFVACHQAVRDRLREVDYLLVYPCLELEDEWIKRAEERYKNNKEEKYLKALERVKYLYKQDIETLNGVDKRKIILENTNYDLEELVLRRCGR